MLGALAPNEGVHQIKNLIQTMGSAHAISATQPGSGCYREPKAVQLDDR
jgi:hypothetical protein